MLVSPTALRLREVLKWRTVGEGEEEDDWEGEGRAEVDVAVTVAAVLKAREWESSSAWRRLMSFICRLATRYSNLFM